MRLKTVVTGHVAIQGYLNLRLDSNMLHFGISIRLMDNSIGEIVFCRL